LQSEGEGIPKEMVKKLAENKLKTLPLHTTYATNSIIGMEYFRSVLANKPWYQRRQGHGSHM
jgi:hypothetical protein